jgi:inner membrane protein
MDNLTHTLISAMVGEAIHRSVPPSTTLTDGERRNVAIAVMVVGGNLPDADVIYTTWAGSPLAYLLHHRGHTHTVVGALILSAALFLAVRLWWRYRKVEPHPADIRFLLGLSVLATLLHIGLDFTNSYGVHPFWPVDDHWYYGDAIFIVEPLLWACSAALLFTVRNTIARALVALVLAAGIGLSWFSGLVPASLAALLTLLTLGLAVVGRHASARAALTAGIIAWLVVTAVFATTSRTAKARVDAILADGFPTARTLDTVLTPTPANPVCREVLAVQLEGNRYVIRTAFHSSAPGWIPADDCAELNLSGTRTAPLVPVARASTAEMAWTGELSMAADLPAAIARDYCAADALMQFARAPWAVRQGDGWVIGDLRYDREPELGIAEVDVGPSTDDCPRFRPPWVPPRQDLLTGG